MSIIDSNLVFSGTQASGGSITGETVTATALSTNVYNCNPGSVAPNTLRNLNPDGTMYLLILVTAAFVRAAGAMTVTFSLESDSVDTIDSSATVHWTSAAISKATLVAGYKLLIPLPSEATYEKYLAVRYTCSATGDSGAVFATLTNQPERYTQYEDNITIS